MAATSHDQRGERRSVGLAGMREMWASIAIATMWVAVTVDAIWGPDIVSSAGPGGASTTLPSAVVVAVFAWLGTWSVAKHALHSSRGD